MKNLKHLKPINDVYFIDREIKNINENYQIFYNTQTKKYEIHDLQKKYGFVISYDKYPDQNMIKKLYSTNLRNSKKIYEEIEKHNKILYEKQRNGLLDESSQRFKEILSYAQKTTRELSQEDMKKII